MTMEDNNRDELTDAGGVQKEPEVLPFKPSKKGGPIGNKKAQKHGAYSRCLTRKEQRERAQFESELAEDLAGDVSAAQRALIRRAGFLEIRLRRCERADSKGLHIPDEHILAWINSQRLLLTALGLKRKQRSAPNLQDYLRQKAESTNKTYARI
jgi:hypothetical protein